jgi:hypothetical protein
MGVERQMTDIRAIGTYGLSFALGFLFGWLAASGRLFSFLLSLLILCVLAGILVALWPRIKEWLRKQLESA